MFKWFKKKIHWKIEYLYENKTRQAWILFHSLDNGFGNIDTVIEIIKTQLSKKGWGEQSVQVIGNFFEKCDCVGKKDV